MKFPKKLIITLKSGITRVPVANHALYLRIRAQRKNNYDIGLRLTNELGQTIFTEEEIKEEINWTRNNFLMDYASSYEECLSEFYVVLFSKEGLQKCAQALKLYMSFGEKIVKDLELINRAGNVNSAEQKWNFNTKKLILEDGVTSVECLVD